MNPETTLIITCVILIAVLAGYTVYRLITDKEKDGKKNLLYPLNSNPSDPMIPKARNKLELVAYIAIPLSILGTIMFVFFDLNDIGNIDSMMMVYIVNALFLIGIICVVVSKFITKK